jgi:hypothetical protein
LVLCVAVAAGCGGGSSGSNGEASKSASQILSDAGAAVGRAHSVTLGGTFRQENRPWNISAELEQPDKAHLTLSRGSSTAAVTTLGGTAYLKASASFYAGLKDVPSATVALIADRWFKLPSSTELGFLAHFNLPTLGRCLAQEPGTLSVSGTTSVDGKPAVVVTDKGDVPGSTPSKFYVATSGEPVLLRAVATGKQQPGGSRSECNEGSPAEPGQELIFSGYNRPANIAAPAGAIDLSQLTH